MFQPRVKLEFVRRYCSPRAGWQVYVDIDPSEEGRTGGMPRTREARDRRRQMHRDAWTVREGLRMLGVTADGGRLRWHQKSELPRIEGDRDIVAFNRKHRVYVIAEVEGASSGQPEQKLYKAIGQLVRAAGDPPAKGWRRRLVLVVAGDAMAAHLAQVRVLHRLSVSGLVLDEALQADRWLFGPPLPRIRR